MKKLSFLLLIFSAFALFSCKKEAENGTKQRLSIVCTTGMLADGVKNMVSDSADVIALMGPGVDPHLYKPSPGDMDKLEAADIIVINGLHLEGKMQETLERFEKKGKKVVVAAQGIPAEKVRKVEGIEGAQDPHIWFNVELWAEAMGFVGQEISKVATAQASFIQQNTEKYKQSLLALHNEVNSTLSSIPKDNRILITSHDAFGYFGEAYGLQVFAVQGVSTLSEPGVKDINDMVQKVIASKSKAIFLETSVSEKYVKAVVEGCAAKNFTVAVGQALYSDAMGENGTEQGTYIGMIKHNSSAIAKALSN